MASLYSSWFTLQWSIALVSFLQVFLHHVLSWLTPIVIIIEIILSYANTIIITNINITITAINIILLIAITMILEQPVQQLMP